MAQDGDQAKKEKGHSTRTRARKGMPQSSSTSASNKQQQAQGNAAPSPNSTEPVAAPQLNGNKSSGGSKKARRVKASSTAQQGGPEEPAMQAASTSANKKSDKKTRTKPRRKQATKGKAPGDDDAKQADSKKEDARGRDKGNRKNGKEPVPKTGIDEDAKDSKQSKPGNRGKGTQNKKAKRRDKDDGKGSKDAASAARSNPKSASGAAQKTGSAAKKASRAEKSKKKRALRQLSGSNASGGSGGAGAELKIRKTETKVIVRLLPPDLPEHVFWKSIEPALPWYDPQNAGAVVQKAHRVAAYMTDAANVEPEEAEGESAGPSGAGRTEENGSGSLDEASRDCSSDPAPPQHATKAISIDVYESRNLERLDNGHPYWRQFCPGKVYKTRSKPSAPSRAYIGFATRDEAEHFFKRYSGHVFYKNNTASRVAIELAPFQYTPVDDKDSRAKNDALEGTVDSDPDFTRFLDSLTADQDSSPSASNAAAPLPSQPEPQAAVVSTPLLEYLRAVKSKEAKMVALARSRAIRARNAWAPGSKARGANGSKPPPVKILTRKAGASDKKKGKKRDPGSAGKKHSATAAAPAAKLKKTSGPHR